MITTLTELLRLPDKWVSAKTSLAASYILLVKKTIVPDDCGGSFTAANGTITSPGYPNSYGHNKTCIYTISTTFGNNIVLNFSRMDIDYGNVDYYPDNYDYDFDQYIDMGHWGSQGVICFDYLEVRDGASEQSPLIGVFCGYNPVAVRSSHTNLWIKYCIPFQL